MRETRPLAPQFKPLSSLNTLNFIIGIKIRNSGY